MNAPHRLGSSPSLCSREKSQLPERLRDGRRVFLGEQVAPVREHSESSKRTSVGPMRSQRPEGPRRGRPTIILGKKPVQTDGKASCLRRDPRRIPPREKLEHSGHPRGIREKLPVVFGIPGRNPGTGRSKKCLDNGKPSHQPRRNAGLKSTSYGTCDPFTQKGREVLFPSTKGRGHRKHRTQVGKVVPCQVKGERCACGVSRSEHGPDAFLLEDLSECTSKSLECRTVAREG